MSGPPKNLETGSLNCSKSILAFKILLFQKKGFC